MSYCVVQDLRDEGVPSTGYGAKTDEYLGKVIIRVCAMIDNFTGRFFEPRDLTLVLDGTGSRALLFGDPIIDIDTIKLDSDDFSLAEEYDLDDVRIYNRHLTERLTNPDDRESPKIEILEFDRREESLPAFGTDAHSLFHMHRWPEGTQNIQVVGTFGYTDWDDDEDEGVTPILIERAAVLMVLRDLNTGYTEIDRREDERNRWRVTEHKTRDQTIKFEKPSVLGLAGFGAFTGDPEIDSILAQYVRPPRFGSA